MLKTSYYIICFGDAAAYRVYVYMLHPLQGGRSTGYARRPTSVTDSQSALNRHSVRPFTESDDTRGCNNTICPEDEQRTDRNMLRIIM